MKRVRSEKIFSEKKRLGLRCIAIAIIFFVGASLSQAQLPTATILGVVKDSSGAVVLGANLTARNLETGQTRTTVTEEDGSYRFSALSVGSYEVRAEHTGFRTELRNDLILTVSQEAVVNFALEPGAVEETVSVTADAPLVNTTNSSLGSLVSEAKIADLPLNGRNYIDLVLLQPGINLQANKSFGGSGIGTSFSSNGATFYSNSYLLDGTSTVNFYGASSSSGSGTTLGMDGIREYRVVTNSASAEYGMTMGAQTLIVTKSGTNSLHGSVFEYIRNSALDARNFFDFQTANNPGRLPAFKRNNFGASLGGPIRKDKTFFYGTYEALRERKGISNVLTTIPAADKVDGVLVPQINSAIKPLLPFFPDGNIPGSPNQLYFTFSQPNTDNYGQIRVDHNISASDTVFARYTIDDGTFIIPLNWPAFEKSLISRNQYLTLSENHIISPRLLNTFRTSFSRTNLDQGEIFGSGLSGPQFAFITGNTEPGNISIGGISSGWGTGNSSPIHPKQNIFSWSDDLYYTRGRHSLKFGTLINHYQWYDLSSQNSKGTIAFANLTSFLLGQPSSYKAGTPGLIQDHTFHYNTIGFYAQDDIRVTSRLTLNLGLRYEFNTSFNDPNNMNASLRDPLHDVTTTVGSPFNNPSFHNFGPRVGFAWDVMGDGKTAVRGGFGLLYDVLSVLNESIHAADCVPPFCSSSSVTVSPANSLTLTSPLSSSLVFPPASVGRTVKELDYNMNQPHMFQYNLAIERQLPANMALTVAYAGSHGLNLIQIEEGNPTIPQILSTGQEFWTGNEKRVNPAWDSVEIHSGSGNSSYNSLQVSLLKRLSKGLQFQSSYTWSKLIDTNPTQTGGDSLTSVPFPSDQANMEGDRAPASYDIPQNWRFNLIYQLPNVVSADHTIGKVLNGWSVSGIISAESGVPFSPAIATNRSNSKEGGGGTVQGTGASTDRPNILPGRDNSNITSGTTAGCPGVAAGQQLGTPQLWFDPCAFALQPAGFLGNAGRNILRGPGLNTVDFSVTKDLALHFLGEAGKLTFRSDFFNIFNHANFSPPFVGGNVQGAAANSGAIIFSGKTGDPVLTGAGQLTSTTTSSRQIQFSLRVAF